MITIYLEGGGRKFTQRILFARIYLLMCMCGLFRVVVPSQMEEKKRNLAALKISCGSSSLLRTVFAINYFWHAWKCDVTTTNKYHVKQIMQNKNILFKNVSCILSEIRVFVPLAQPSVLANLYYTIYTIHGRIVYDGSKNEKKRKM